MSLTKQETSAHCRQWIKQYGRAYRDMVACGRDLTRAGRTQSEARIYTTIHRCRTALDAAAKHASPIQIISYCVRKGYSHGVTQPKRGR